MQGRIGGRVRDFIKERIMPDMDSFAEGLIQETLVDMAESFFGARTELEKEIERFEAQAKVLKKLAEAALPLADLLHALLLNEENAHELYTTLGVRPGRYFTWVDPSHELPPFKRPWALTGRGRYVKAMLRAYDQMQVAFDVYLNGRYYSDPRQHGRKRLSVHYYLMRDWAGHINRRIRKVNEGQAPSCVLAFAKSLDVEAVTKERVTDAPLDTGGINCKLDQDLAFKPVSLFDLGLKELPDLPSIKLARVRVARLARQVWRADKALARAALNGLPQPPQKA